MMHTYAHIKNGLVLELFEPMTWPDGSEVEPADRFTPDIAANLVDITDVSPAPRQGDTYSNGVFTAYAAPVPTTMEISAANSAVRDSLMDQAVQVLSPLQMAVMLGIATDAEKAKAAIWVNYSRSVQAVDITQQSPVWPSQPT